MNGDRNSTQRYGWYVQYSNMNYIVIGLHLFAFPLFLVYVLLANRSLYVDPSSKSPAALENFYETYVSFGQRRGVTLIAARGMKLTRLCSHAPVAALLPARVGQA